MSVARAAQTRAGIGQAAIRLSQSLEHLVLGRAALMAIEAGAIPFFLLTSNCEVVHLSHPGLMLLQAERAFSRRGNRLHLRRRDELAAFRDGVKQALTGKRTVCVRLHNRQGEVNHLLTIRAVPNAAMVVLLVAELRERTLLPRGWSRNALDLPASLAELAEALTDGETLAEFGERVGLTFEGARTRLRKLLMQTGTKSQMELTALMNRAATVVFLPGS